MTASLCGDESLELVLSDNDQHPDYDAVVEHLGQCETCRRRLDDLAARPLEWQSARRYLADLEQSSGPVLPPVETLVMAELSTASLPAPVDVTAVLDQPSHPEMLGRLGKYDIECEIGRGGMGIVLKGFDSDLHRPVAIKLLAPHLASCGTARQRFVREAQAAAAVVHDNVVAIHGIETGTTLPALVMPYISGHSLHQHIREQGALPPEDVVRIGIQVAAGLAAAHDQGLVHRDIKPANILLENGINRIQITDFGLARAAHDVDLTRTGVITGTPAFMSPEQSLNDGVDARSDLFSLGAVLYLAATGRLPFRASTPVGVLQQVCHVTPVRPRELNSGVPVILESVIEKLLEKSPQDRFLSASELHDYLTEYLAHLQQPTKTGPPKRIESSVRRGRRRRWLNRLAISSILLASCGTLLWLNPIRWADTSAGRSAVETSGTVRPPKNELAEWATVVSAAELDREITELIHDLDAAEQRPPVHLPPVESRHDQEVRQLAIELEQELLQQSAQRSSAAGSSRDVHDRPSPDPDDSVRAGTASD